MYMFRRATAVGAHMHGQTSGAATLARIRSTLGILLLSTQDSFLITQIPLQQQLFSLER